MVPTYISPISGSFGSSSWRCLRIRNFISSAAFSVNVKATILLLGTPVATNLAILRVMTSVLPEGRFGSIEIDEKNRVKRFKEKQKGDGSWVNGGFFVCEPEVLDYISDDTTIFEREPLENIAKDNQLYSYKHKGFWKPMDTLRDKMQLEDLIDRKEAPWMRW